MKYKKNHIAPIFIGFFILCAVSASALLYFNGYKWYRDFFPDVSVLKVYYPVAIKKTDQQILYKLQKSRPEYWMSLSQISKRAIWAVIISEDGGFYQHNGYEPEAIRDAIEHNLKSNVKVKRGGSTITQQVVKNIFLTHEKTLIRKARELLLAIELERTFSKSKILELYLNIAEWGPGIYGIEQASLKYFHKHSANLSAREGAILAFMLPSPNKYQHSYNEGELTDFGKDRVETILERMWKAGYIDFEEYSSAMSEDTVSFDL